MTIRNRLSAVPFILLAVFLLAGTGNCFAQDSTSQKAICFPLQRNILLVKSNKTNLLLPPRNGYFRVRYNVEVVSNTNGTPDKGHIQFISDSSIFLNGKEIKMSDIVSIKKSRGKTTTIVGASTFAGSLITFFSLAHYYANKEYDYYYEGDGGMLAEILTFFAVIGSGITTLVGGIQMATIKKYHMDSGDWAFEVKQDVFSSTPGNFSPQPFPVKKKKAENK